MICNKCGNENPDDALTCWSCGHKLQSGQAWLPAGGAGRAGFLEPIPMLEEQNPPTRVNARKHVEAWVVAVLVWGAAYGLLTLEVLWPLYPMAGLAMAYAWWRGITWRG